MKFMSVLGSAVEPNAEHGCGGIKLHAYECSMFPSPGTRARRDLHALSMFTARKRARAGEHGSCRTAVDSPPAACWNVSRI